MYLLPQTYSEYDDIEQDGWSIFPTGDQPYARFTQLTDVGNKPSGLGSSDTNEFPVSLTFYQPTSRELKEKVAKADEAVRTARRKSLASSLSSHVPGLDKEYTSYLGGVSKSNKKYTKKNNRRYKSRKNHK